MATTTIEQKLPKKQSSFQELVESSPESTLTPTQKKIHEELLSWFTENSKHPAAVLGGYAGVGKTYLSNILIESLSHRGKTGVAAPTHKAVKVLTKTAVPGVDYRTVHSMLALKERKDLNTGEVSYETDRFSEQAPPVEKLKFLIIDESSMLDDTLFMHLVPWIKKGLKVLFVGDLCQIPPVNHKDSIPFYRGRKWGFKELELTEIIRQKEDNPILEFVTDIRNTYKTQHQYYPGGKVNSSGEGIRLVAKSEEESIYQDYFDTEEFRKDADWMKVIAWRNKTVDRYNKDIRRVIYGTDVAPIIVGEKLVMEESYQFATKEVLNRNEDLTVLDLRTKPQEWKYRHRGVEKLLLGNIDWLTVRWVASGRIVLKEIPVLHEDTKAMFWEMIQNVISDAHSFYGEARKRAWKQYFQLQASVAWVNYGYAITAHKSQGSSYGNCLVLKWDLESNRDIEERNRILYTACTRPRHLLMIES